MLGINSQIKSTSGGGEGVGFAIPVDAVRRSLRELRRDGQVDYGYLGVTSQPLYPQLARRLDLPVTTRRADRAGSGRQPGRRRRARGGRREDRVPGPAGHPVGGDVVVAVDGRKLTQTADLADLISATNAGDEVALEVIRDGKRRTVKVELGERPDEPPERP